MIEKVLKELAERHFEVFGNTKFLLIPLTFNYIKEITVSCIKLFEKLDLMRLDVVACLNFLWFRF